MINWRIRNMGVLAAFMVVGLHTGYSGKLVEGASGWWLYHVCCRHVFQMAVPLFFVISGYFVALKSNDRTSWRSVVGRRIRTVLVPYFLWTFLYAGIAIAFSLVADVKAHRILGANLEHGLGVLKYIGLHPIDAPTFGVTWYLLNLFVLVCMWPGIDWLIRHFKVVALALLFFVMVVIRGNFSDPADKWYWFFRYRFCIEGLFCFALGMYIGYGSPLTERVGKALSNGLIRIAALVGIGLFWVLSLCWCVWWRGGIVVYECFLLLGMATLFLSTPIREMKVTRLVDKCGGSMAVYLLHFVVIYFLRIPFDMNSIGGQLLRYVLTLGGTLMLGVALRRLVPKTFSFMLGGRL